MVHMALSPSVTELQVLQRHFINSPEYKSVENERFAASSEPRKRKMYSTEVFLNEFCFTSPRGVNLSRLIDAQTVLKNLPLCRWSEPIRFAETGDDEVDEHIRTLLEWCSNVRNWMQCTSLPIDETSTPTYGDDCNCFVYFVPKEAKHLIKGHFEKIKVRIERTNPRDTAETQNKYNKAQENGERRRRQDLAEIGTFSKFPAQHANALAWLEQRQSVAVSDERVIPFAPFNLFNLDGFLVADATHNIKAAVAIIDGHLCGKAKLELVTEFFVRAFGLPGINRATMRSVTSRRKRPLGFLPHTLDPDSLGVTITPSLRELRAMMHLYSTRLANGMTSAEINASLRER